MAKLKVGDTVVRTGLNVHGDIVRGFTYEVSAVSACGKSIQVRDDRLYWYAVGKFSLEKAYEPKAGDVLICTVGNNRFTEGKEYTIQEYRASHQHLPYLIAGVKCNARSWWVNRDLEDTHATYDKAVLQLKKQAPSLVVPDLADSTRTGRVRAGDENISIPRFKIGDTIRRVHCNFKTVVVGKTYTVTGVRTNGEWLSLDGHYSTSDYPFHSQHFELVNDNLEPYEVLACIHKGIPLEIKTITGWEDVVAPSSITAYNLLNTKYREKVIREVIEVAGLQFHAPLREVPTECSTVYVIDLRTFKVTTRNSYNCTDGDTIWGTREEAEVALSVLAEVFKRKD